MAWMFRWLESLLARLPLSRGGSDGWVEPSNAITRAILANAVPPLPSMAAAPAEPAQPAPEVAAPAEPETRTERKTRRRRAARAA